MTRDNRPLKPVIGCGGGTYPIEAHQKHTPKGTPVFARDGAEAVQKVKRFERPPTPYGTWKLFSWTGDEYIRVTWACKQ